MQANRQVNQCDIDYLYEKVRCYLSVIQMWYLSFYIFICRYLYAVYGRHKKALSNGLV